MSNTEDGDVSEGTDTLMSVDDTDQSEDDGNVEADDTSKDDVEASSDKAKEGEGDGKSEDADKGDKDKNEAAPEKYEDFKLPEGMEVNTDLLDKATPVFKELNLTQDQAQKMVDLQTTFVSEMAVA